MRSGGCTVQQALTPEAATMVKQAVSLARRRGHAQVTPLHVASAMLSSSTGLLRAACLHSHSHPLQCKALELCFNVALNRLPASCSSSSPTMLSPRYHPPSLSNALVAAFKRAQAHQRRGSVETQQQPLLAVKIELEQLIISILDDPSVSRVMREAGFSSTQVKSNVEQAVASSPETTSPNPNPNPSPSKPVLEGSSTTMSPPTQSSKTAKPLDQSEDVRSLVKALMSRKKRSVVVVGECLSTSEGAVKGLMDKVDKGEVPEVLRDLQFISAPQSFQNMSRNEMELRVGELRSLVKSCCVGRGAVLYLGNLKWAADYWTSYNDGERNFYCPIEAVMREIGRLVGDESGRFWVIGAATYQIYMKCRTGNPSLETLWSLQPLTIPAGSLDLSLNFDSDLESQWQCKRNGGAPWLLKNGDGNQLTCCADCSIKFQNEAQGLQGIIGSSVASNMPSWLQPYRGNNKGVLSRNDQDCNQLKDLYQKWNSICNSSHNRQHPSYEKTLYFSDVSPSSSSISSYGQCYSGFQQIHQSWPVPVGAKQPWRDRCFWMLDTVGETFESSSRICSQEYYKEQTSSSQPCVNATKYNRHSASSTETMETGHLHKFMELSAENLKTLCNALEERVSWQSDIIPEIVSTILQCRSGMMRRKDKSITAKAKEETWLFFQGSDVDAKEKIARELANLIFGSHTNFVSISLSNFSSMRSESTTDINLRNKRSREEVSHSYIEKFAETIHKNPHRVILMEDVDQVDYYSQKSLKTAIERGRIQRSNGEGISISDAIIIFSCERFDSRSRACSPSIKQKTETSDEEREEDCEKDVISSCICLDLNVCAEDEEVENWSSDDVGLLESVDRTFFFKLPDDM